MRENSLNALGDQLRQEMESVMVAHATGWLEPLTSGLFLLPELEADTAELFRAINDWMILAEWLTSGFFPEDLAGWETAVSPTTTPLVPTPAPGFSSVSPLFSSQVPPPSSMLLARRRVLPTQLPGDVARPDVIASEEMPAFPPESIQTTAQPKEYLLLTVGREQDSAVGGELPETTHSQKPGTDLRKVISVTPSLKPPGVEKREGLLHIPPATSLQPLTASSGELHFPTETEQESGLHSAKSTEFVMFDDVPQGIKIEHPFSEPGSSAFTHSPFSGQGSDGEEGQLIQSRGERLRIDVPEFLSGEYPSQTKAERQTGRHVSAPPAKQPSGVGATRVRKLAALPSTVPVSLVKNEPENKPAAKGLREFATFLQTAELQTTSSPSDYLESALEESEEPPDGDWLGRIEEQQLVGGISEKGREEEKSGKEAEDRMNEVRRGTAVSSQTSSAVIPAPAFIAPPASPTEKPPIKRQPTQKSAIPSQVIKLNLQMDPHKTLFELPDQTHLGLLTPLPKQSNTAVSNFPHFTGIPESEQVDNGWLDSPDTPQPEWSTSQPDQDVATRAEQLEPKRTDPHSDRAEELFKQPVTPFTYFSEIQQQTAVQEQQTWLSDSMAHLSPVSQPLSPDEWLEPNDIYHIELLQTQAGSLETHRRVKAVAPPLPAQQPARGLHELANFLQNTLSGEWLDIESATAVEEESLPATRMHQLPDSQGTLPPSTRRQPINRETPLFKTTIRPLPPENDVFVAPANDQPVVPLHPSHPQSPLTPELPSFLTTSKETTSSSETAVELSHTPLPTTFAEADIDLILETLAQEIEREYKRFYG